jgi:hypothetical protein
MIQLALEIRNENRRFNQQSVLRAIIFQYICKV